MPSTIVLYAGANIDFEYQLLNPDGTPINLTGGDVKWRFGINGAAMVDKTATIIDAPNGKARYTTLGGGTPDLTAGLLRWMWKFTDSGGKLIYQDAVPFEIVVLAVP